MHFHRFTAVYLIVGAGAAFRQLFAMTGLKVAGGILPPFPLTMSQ
jgi:hypothetical protein